MLLKYEHKMSGYQQIQAATQYTLWITPKLLAWTAHRECGSAKQLKANNSKLHRLNSSMSRGRGRPNSQYCPQSNRTRKTCDALIIVVNLWTQFWKHRQPHYTTRDQNTKANNLELYNEMTFDSKSALTVEAFVRERNQVPPNIERWKHGINKYLPTNQWKPKCKHHVVPFIKLMNFKSYREKWTTIARNSMTSQPNRTVGKDWPAQVVEHTEESIKRTVVSVPSSQRVDSCSLKSVTL